MDETLAGSDEGFIDEDAERAAITDEERKLGAHAEDVVADERTAGTYEASYETGTDA